jgi:hypothetical protein
MANIQSNQALIPSIAPLEPNVTKELDYNCCISLLMEHEGELFSSSTLASLLSSYLKGMGNVDLVELEMAYHLGASGARIAAAIVNENRAIEKDQIISIPGCVQKTANAMNYGETVHVKLFVPDVLSRQIQPVSSLLPNFKLYILASANTVVNLTFKIKFHGPMMIIAKQGF